MRRIILNLDLFLCTGALEMKIVIVSVWVIFSLMSGPGCALPSIEIHAADRLTSHGLDSLAAGRGLKFAGTAGVDENSTFPLFSDKRFSLKNVLRGGALDGWWRLMRSKRQVLPYINRLPPHSSSTHV